MLELTPMPDGTRLGSDFLIGKQLILILSFKELYLSFSFLGFSSRNSFFLSYLILVVSVIVFFLFVSLHNAYLLFSWLFQGFALPCHLRGPTTILFISRDTCRDHKTTCRTILMRCVAKKGIARTYREIQGIAAIVSQYRAMWAHWACHDGESHNVEDRQWSCMYLFGSPHSAT